MAEASSESAVGKFVGAPIMTALGAYVGWLTAGSTGVLGSALAHLLAIGGGVIGLAFTLIYARNVGVLGAGGNEQGTPERQAYEALRKSLAEGNLAARFYADWLTTFLDWIDRFFGDAGMAERTRFSHAFGLRTPAPTWTAPALDCCLFLALLYPIATISVIWAISGQVGPAERAFGLQPDLLGWQRLGVAAAIGLVTYGYWRATSGGNIWKRMGWLVVSITGSVIPFAFGALSLVLYATALAICFSYTRLNTGARKGVLGIIAVFMAIEQGGSAGFWYAIMASTGCAILLLTSKAAVKFGLEGIFYLIFFPVTISALLTAATLMSSLAAWEYSGPVLLFLGLLTLLIAPFDWASLGLTRALLRRGLELGGWWPYALALVDAALAAVIIAALGVTVLIGAQAFDILALHGGGNKPILDVGARFIDGIAAHRSSPEYWWLYALLLSTMIPSLVNLVISGASLARGVPGLPALLLLRLPDARAVPVFDRAWIATVLTLQTVGGALLGIATQVLLAVGIIGYIMPLFGRELLDMAREVAAYNLPARVGQLFGLSL